MNLGIEFYVVISLVVLSVISIFWSRILKYLLGPENKKIHTPRDFQLRMDLINELMRACEGCPEEYAAVVAAGDVIADHWRKPSSHKSQPQPKPRSTRRSK